LKRRALERHLREHGAEVLDEGAKHTKWRGPTGGRSIVAAPGAQTSAKRAQRAGGAHRAVRCFAEHVARR
jgi:hypothetical protein